MKKARPRAVSENKLSRNLGLFGLLDQHVYGQVDGLYTFFLFADKIPLQTAARNLVHK